MSKIKHFVINTTAANLSVLFDDTEKNSSKAIDLSFEYLRVFAPTDDKGQHGYRFIFDDNHSNIYNADYLQLLAAEYQQRWQHYLQSTATAVNSREATIEIKELK